MANWAWRALGVSLALGCASSAGADVVYSKTGVLGACGPPGVDCAFHLGVEEPILSPRDPAALLEGTYFYKLEINKNFVVGLRSSFLQKIQVSRTFDGGSLSFYDVYTWKDDPSFSETYFGYVGSFTVKAFPPETYYGPNPLTGAGYGLVHVFSRAWGGIAINGTSLGAFDGSPFSLEISDSAPVSVPEPSGWVIMLAGAGAVGAALRERRRRQAKDAPQVP